MKIANLSLFFDAATGEQLLWRFGEMLLLIPGKERSAGNKARKVSYLCGHKVRMLPLQFSLDKFAFILGRFTFIEQIFEAMHHLSRSVLLRCSLAN
jgi:hypothetical protein